MSDGFGRLSRESATFALGSIGGRIFGLLLLPFLTRYLNPSEYGQLDVLFTFSSTAISVLSLGFDVAFVRLYYDADESGRRQSIIAYFAMATGLALGGAILIVLAAPLVSNLAFGTPDRVGEFVAVAIILVFGTHQVVVLNILRARRQPGAYAALILLALVGYFLGTLLLLAFAGGSVLGPLLAYAASLAITSTVAVAWILRTPPWRGSFKIAGRIARLGIPLLPMLVVTYAGDLLHRGMLLALAGSTEVGLLSVGLRFASVGAIGVAAFQLAWQPRVYEARATGIDVSLGRDGLRIVGIVSLVALMILATMPLILSLAADASYAGARQAARIAVLIPVGAAVFMVSATRSLLGHATSNLSIASAAGLGAGISITWATAATSGAVGAATGMVVGQFTAAGVISLLARNSGPTDIPWKRVAGSVGATAAIVVLTAALDLDGLALASTVGAAIVALFMIADLGWMGRRVLRRAIRRYDNRRR